MVHRVDEYLDFSNNFVLINFGETLNGSLGEGVAKVYKKGGVKARKWHSEQAQ
jgi:hypothetical protein